MIEFRKKGFLILIPSVILLILSLMLLGARETETKIFGFIWLTISVTLHVLKWEWIIKETSKEPREKIVEDAKIENTTQEAA